VALTGRPRAIAGQLEIGATATVSAPRGGNNATLGVGL
jgi:hypothetical protein